MSSHPWASLRDVRTDESSGPCVTTSTLEISQQQQLHVMSRPTQTQLSRKTSTNAACEECQR